MNDQPAERPRAPEPRVADFPHRVTDTIRFGDLDPQGHVNQAVFLTYFESGRVAMFRNKDLGIGVPGATFVLVRIEIDYRRELHWPGTIEVGTSVAESHSSWYDVTPGATGRDTSTSSSTPCTMSSTRLNSSLSGVDAARYCSVRFSGEFQSSSSMR